MNERLLDFLKMNDVEYREGESLSALSSVKIGGKADLSVSPRTEAQLSGLLSFLGKENIKHKIVGKMTNILAPDRSYHGVIIKTDKLSSFNAEDNVITVSSGLSIPLLVRRAAEVGLGGLSPISGIPGSVGGAVVGNAGAFGLCISDVFISARAYSYKEGRILTLFRDDMSFDYRKSALKGGEYAIIEVKLAAEREDKNKVISQISNYRKIRLKTQPSEPSLGSTFKRPTSGYASELIDRCALKGKMIGGAVVSEKHAGFIVNRGGASSADYKALADHIRNAVMDRFSVELEREIEYLQE